MREFNSLLLYRNIRYDHLRFFVLSSRLSYLKSSKFDLTNNGILLRNQVSTSTAFCSKFQKLSEASKLFERDIKIDRFSHLDRNGPNSQMDNKHDDKVHNLRTPKFTNFATVYLLAHRGDLDGSRKLINENITWVMSLFGVVVAERDPNRVPDSGGYRRRKSLIEFTLWNLVICIAALIAFIYYSVDNIKQALKYREYVDIEAQQFTHLTPVTLEELHEQVIKSGKLQKIIYYPAHDRALVRVVADEKSSNTRDTVPDLVLDCVVFDDDEDLRNQLNLSTEKFEYVQSPNGLRARSTPELAAMLVGILVLFVLVFLLGQIARQLNFLRKIVKLLLEKRLEVEAKISMVSISPSSKPL